MKMICPWCGEEVNIPNNDPDDEDYFCPTLKRGFKKSDCDRARID